MKPPARCGTVQAGWRHNRHKEPVDRPCQDALNAYNRERRATADERKTARQEAMEALSWRHPTEFEELLRKALVQRG